MKQIILNGKKFDLPCVIEPSCFAQFDNSSVLNSKLSFKAVIIEIDKKLVFMSKNKVTFGGKSVPGGIIILRNRKNLIRIEGFLINLEVSDIFWVLKPYDGNEGICPVCKLPFDQECFWQCSGCGIKVHDSAFCRPITIDEPCFNCER